MNGASNGSQAEAQTTRPDDDDDNEAEADEDGLVEGAPGAQARRPRRRLSGFESIDETVDPDLERDTTAGGTAKR